MAFFDENGNPLDESSGTPTFPEQSPRKIESSIKDKDEENFAKVDEDGSLNVKVTNTTEIQQIIGSVVVTDMPPMTVNAEGIVVNVSNQVEVTNNEGDPIPVSGTVDIGNFPEPPTSIEVSNLPENQLVTIANEVLTVDVNNLAFPEVQEVSGSVNATISGEVTVGNFPTTQAVSIADTVEVSVANQPTVTISNPVEEVSVSNFPTSFDVTVSNPTTEVSVSNFPTEISVTNQPTSIEVSNFPEPVTSVEVSNFPANQTISGEVSVSNFPTEVAINNFPATPTSIEVSNLPENQSVTVTNTDLNVTVSNFPTEISVSNQPTEIAVNNFPTSFEVSNFPNTIEVSNMIESDSIGQAVNQYFEQRYTLYSDNATMYADAMPPSLDPYGRDGFHYLNNWSVDATTNQKKINWYFYDPTRTTSTYAQLANAWALVTMDKATTHPFFYIYGTTNFSTVSSAWVFSAKTVTLQAGKTYLFYFGTEEPTVFPDVPRVQLAYNPTSSYGTRNPSEYVLSIAITTNSGDASSATEFQTYALGYKANNNEQSVKLVMKNTNTTTVTGTVDIGNLPETQNVLVTNETLTVDVNNLAFPEVQQISGTVEVSNQPTTIEVSNFPTSTEVSNTVTVTGTVDVGNLAFPETQNVNVTNSDLNVTVSNPTTSVEVSNLPTNQSVTVTNTEPIQVDVNNLAFPEVQTVDGTVSVDSLPAINITNTGFEATITNTNLDVTFTNTTIDVGNLPSNQDVTITNASVNVTVDNPTTAVDVNNFPANQVVSGTVSVDSLPSIAITNTGFDATILNTDLPVTFSNTSIEVSNFPATQTITGDVNATVTGSVDVNNFPTTIEVSNLPSVQDVNVTNQITSVDVTSLPEITIANTGFDATITNTDLSVTVSNPQTSVDVTSLPAIAITNTGFDATILNTDLPVTFSNTSIEVSNSPTVKIDSTQNIVKIDGTTEVEIKNSVGSEIPVVLAGSMVSIPVKFDQTDPNNIVKITGEVEVKNSEGSDIPVFIAGTASAITVKLDQVDDNNKVDIGTMPSVVIDDTTPVDVNITNALTIEPPANQNVTVTNESPIAVSGTISIDSTTNSVKLTDGTNIAGVLSTGEVKTTITAGAGTSEATPLYMVIVGSIDGGAI